MKKILFIAAAIATLVGCTKDADVASLGDNALTISSNITTRVTNEQWEKGDAIGVYMFVSTFGDKGANVEFTTDGSGIFTSDDPLYLPSSSEAKVFAYYPYLEHEEMNIFAYPIKSVDQVDLLSAIKSNVTTSSVELTFYHQLSKVSLTIKAGEGLTAADLDALEVKLSGVITQATIDLTCSEISSDSIDEAAEFEFTTAADGTSSSAIVIPQKLTDATLCFTTKNYGTFSATLTTQEFKMSNEYTYAATISRNGVEITSSNIEVWDDGDTTAGSASIVDIEYKSGKYYINSGKGLAAFRDLVNGASNTQNATFLGFENDTDNGGDNGVAFGTSYISIDGVLTQDVDLSTICYEVVDGDDVNWTPIGFGNIYCGTFDGCGYEVQNLYINTSNNYQGLFGYYALCTSSDEHNEVKNLGVSGSVTSTGDYCGGIVAYVEGANIIGCYNKADVTGYKYIGGVVGYMRGDSYSDHGTILGCYNLGNIKGGSNVGGVVGLTVYADVQSLYSAGSVSSSQITYSGGCIGQYYETASSYCYYNNETISDGVDQTYTNYPTTIMYDHYGYPLADSTGDAIATGRAGLSTTDMQDASRLLSYLNAGVAAYNTTNNTDVRVSWVKNTNVTNGGYPLLSWSVATQ